MAFNTGNPVPSTDGRDLSDNAEIIDGFANSTAASVNDRLGVPRRTLSKINSQALELEAQYVFTAINSGVWAAGQIFTALNQYMVFSGTAYKPKNSTSLPYVVGATPVGDNNVEVVANLSTAQGDARYPRQFDTVDDMILTSPEAGQKFETIDYRSTQRGGGAEYLVKTAAQAATDGDVIDGFGNHTLANGNVAILQDSTNRVSLKKFGARDGQDAAANVVAAATFLLAKTDPGGTIHWDGDYNLLSSVNFWDILAAEQGITPADNFLPNGELVRGTYIALQGDGYERSKVFVSLVGDAFVWGNFTNIGSKRAMSGHADGIDFRGNGAIGHTSQLIIDNGTQSYSTTTNASAGTTNVDTRCLVFEECVPNTFVTNCRFRHFQEAIHQTFGFGFVGDRNDIQFCNIGYFFDTGVTTWDVRSGNEVELCAVGVYSKNTSNGLIGAAVIEANLAGCDVLVFVSKFLSMDGTWFEGSLENVVAKGDQFAATLPNSGWALSNIVGLNIDSDGGMVNLHVQDCAMNILGESFSANTGEQFKNIVYDNCTLSEAGFDTSTISVAGVATLDEISVIGPTVGGTISDYAIRESLVKKDTQSASSNVGNNTCFTLEIDNEITTGRIEIEGYWRTAPANDFQMYTFKYVGVISRNTGAGSIVVFLANESITTLYPTTGTNVPNLPTLPNTTVTGATGDTQEVTVEFALGTSASQSADTQYTATIMNQTDGIRYK